MNKPRIRVYTASSWNVAYYVYERRVYRLDYELMDLFKVWEDLQNCDGHVPFVGY